MNNKHSGRGLYGKGYYITLAISAVAIAAAGYWYYLDQQPVAVEEPQATVAAAATEEVLEIIGATEDATPVLEPTAVLPKTLKTAAPVAGETVAGYAMDCLSYNETTRDWRVHNGVDIAAEAGTEVLAAADGTVYTTYTDDVMGTTVVIRHTGGYTTQYASLSEELKVSPGDQVVLGQAIGCVGETALIETNSVPHVHFTVLLEDEPVDPGEFLTLGGE